MRENISHLALKRGKVIQMESTPYCVLEVIDNDVRLYDIERGYVVGFVDNMNIKNTSPQRVKVYDKSQAKALRANLKKVLPPHMKGYQVVYADKSIIDDSRWCIVITSGLNEVSMLYADEDMAVDVKSLKYIDIDTLRRTPVEEL